MRYFRIGTSRMSSRAPEPSPGSGEGLSFSSFLSSSPKALFVLVEELFQVTGDPGYFFIGEAPHCSGEDGVVHTDVYAASHTVMALMSSPCHLQFFWSQVASG